MIIERAQPIPFIMGVHLASSGYLRAALVVLAAFVKAPAFTKGRIGLASALLILSEVHADDRIRLTKPLDFRAVRLLALRCLVVSSRVFACFRQIFRAMQIEASALPTGAFLGIGAHLWTGLIALAHIVALTRLAPDRQAIRLILVATKLNIGLITARATFEVWYSGHIGLPKRLVMLPAVSAARGLCVPSLYHEYAV